jgi:predicted DNA-binding transcriptional regulator AlpA
MRNRTGNVNYARVPRRSGGEGLSIVPRLEELVADPEQVRVLDAHTTRVLRTQAIAALNVLNAHELDAARVEVEPHMRPSGDRLLKVDQAAAKLGMTPDWLYRHHRDFPFIVRHGRPLRFSELGIEEHIRKRRG